MLEENKQKCTPIETITESFDENCIDYLRTLECSICRPGRFWNGLNCVECGDVEGCLMCDTLDISLCKLCKSGFYMNREGDCMRIYAREAVVIESMEIVKGFMIMALFFMIN